MRDCELIRIEQGDFATTSTTCSPSSSLASVNDERNECKSHQIEVEVEAPATLSEGYVFWATTPSSCNEDGSFRRCDSPLNHQSVTFPVKVPSGGVSVGETMRVPLLAHPLEEHDTFDVGDSDSSRLSIDSEHLEKYDNRGKWKAGICSCLERGIFHPNPWSAWLCPQILLGQILMRTNLVSLAQPTASCQRKDSSKLSKCLLWTFRILLCIGVAAYLNFTLYQNEVLTLSHAMEPSRALEVFWWQELVSLILTLPMSIWAFLVVIRLRRTIRERYEIPPGTLGNSEDLVCAICCACCVLSQMARQTDDCDELNLTTSEKQNDDNANSKRLFGWFRKQPKITPSLPLVTTTPPSPSNSTASDNSHLRYRLLSSPSS